MLLHYSYTAIAASGSSHIDLGMAIVGIAPASTLEKAVRSGDMTERDTTGQIAASINHTTS